MICPKCNKKIKNNSKFCPVCGVAIVVVKAEPSVSMGDKITNAFEWIMENWWYAIWVILIAGLVLGELKDMIRGLLK